MPPLRRVFWNCSKSSICIFHLVSEKSMFKNQKLNKNDIKMLYECLTLVEGKTGKPVKQ